MTKFSPGDRVRYRTSDQKGTVGFIDEKYVLVNWDNQTFRCGASRPHHELLIKLKPARKGREFEISIRQDDTIMGIRERGKPVSVVGAFYSDNETIVVREVINPNCTKRQS
jgi:hypothetical protein